MPTALGHLRICDFTGQLAGAGATRWLAAFGAEVIRIEDPTNQGQWDLLRGNYPFVDERRGIELGGSFNNHNVEKLGVTLNLRDDRARELLRKLIAVSDVVTENFASGVLERMGFGYDELRRIRPDIIYVSNCGFGHVGPYRKFKTWGPIVQACCGLAFSSGLPGRLPAGWGYSYMDHHGGNFMAIAVLAALVHRTRTGEGQWVDMSCTQAGAAMLGPAVLDGTANGRPLRREGMPNSNRSQFPAMAPHGIYRAADDPETGGERHRFADDNWVAVACRDDDEWIRAAKVMGIDDRRFDDLAGRLAFEDDLDAAVGRWARPLDRFEAARRLLAVGVPAAAVTRPEDRVEHDPTTAAWGLWPEVAHPEIGRVRVDGIAAHLSHTDWCIEHGAPLLGQHNHRVFCDLLGEPAERIDALAKEGVL